MKSHELFYDGLHFIWVNVKCSEFDELVTTSCLIDALWSLKQIDSIERKERQSALIQSSYWLNRTSSGIGSLVPGKVGRIPFACELSDWRWRWASSKWLTGRLIPSEMSDWMTFNGLDWNCDLRKSFISFHWKLCAIPGDSSKRFLLQRDFGLNVSWAQTSEAVERTNNNLMQRQVNFLDILTFVHNKLFDTSEVAATVVTVWVEMVDWGGLTLLRWYLYELPSSSHRGGRINSSSRMDWIINPPTFQPWSIFCLLFFTSFWCIRWMYPSIRQVIHEVQSDLIINQDILLLLNQLYTCNWGKNVFILLELIFVTQFNHRSLWGWLWDLWLVYESLSVDLAVRFLGDSTSTCMKGKEYETMLTIRGCKETRDEK